jgi:Ras-related GTP-binding protein C/D
VLILEIENSSFVQFQVSTFWLIQGAVLRDICEQIWDFPGQIDFLHPSFDSDAIFSGAQAVVFVIDSQVSNVLNARGYQRSKQIVLQDDYQEALQKLHLTATKAYSVWSLILAVRY